MDKETRYRLEKMGKKYDPLARNVVQNVPNEVYQMTERMANDPKLSRELRERAARTIENGTVKKYDQVVNEKVQRELSDRMDSDMRKGMRDGTIKPANPNDPFLKKMGQAMNR